MADRQLALNPEHLPQPYMGHCKFCDEPITYIATCDSWPGFFASPQLTRFLCEYHGKCHEANTTVDWTIRQVRNRARF